MGVIRAAVRYVGLFIQYWRLGGLIMGQYRLNAAIWLVFSTIYHLSSVGILWAMLQRFPQLGGWTFPEMFFLYALWNLAHGVYAVTLGKVYLLPRQVRDGRFDIFQVRPVNALFQVITTPEAISIHDPIVGVILFTIAAQLLHASLGWADVLLLPWIVLGAALIKGSLLVAIYALTFAAVRMDAGRLLLETIEIELVRFPLSIYPRAVQWAFSFIVPIAFVSFIPAQLVLHKDTSPVVAPELGYLTPLVGLVTFFAGYWLWRLGLRRYQSTGS